MEDALQHYHLALSSVKTVSNHDHDDLATPGVFLRHFLLFVFDICLSTSGDTEGTNTWPIHLDNLRQSAILRHQLHGPEPHAYLLWYICELDMYACLLGSGTCDFMRTIISHNMLPPLEQQIPLSMPSTPVVLLPEESTIFPDIFALREVVVIQTAKLAQAAQSFRREALEIRVITPGTMAMWQASVSQLQNELSTYWTQAYPHYLGLENAQAGEQLPSRVRYVFEHVSLAF